MAASEGLVHILVMPAIQGADPGWTGKMEM